LCGNGIIEYPETCEDGNRLNGDGCDSDCIREPVKFENFADVYVGAAAFS